MLNRISFQTKVISIFIVMAFFDEVFTFQIGSFYLTPLRLFSVFATVLYFNELRSGLLRKTYKDWGLFGFRLLYVYVLISIIFSILSGGETGNLAERFFHFLSSLFTISLFINYFQRKSIDINLLIKLFLYLFYLELVTASIEVIIGRPLIQMGVVDLSPLKIRGFHGDRVYLVEYLTLGLFILYIRKSNLYLILFMTLLSLIIIVTSGSNTGIVLMGITSLYIYYSLKSLKLKISLLALTIIVIASITTIRNSLLSEYDTQNIALRNEMYYSETTDASTNWRLYAVQETLKEFWAKPTIFGNGYETNSKFLEVKSNHLVYMKAHNFVAIIYEYGLIGLILLIFLFYGLLSTVLKMFFLKNRNIYTHLAFIFGILILSRFFFYYHTSMVWVFIFGMPIIFIGNSLVKVSKK